MLRMWPTYTGRGTQLSLLILLILELCFDRRSGMLGCVAEHCLLCRLTAAAGTRKVTGNERLTNQDSPTPDPIATVSALSDREN